jgi:hypothetical protein
MFRSDVWGDSDYSWRQVSLRTRYLLAMGAFHDDLPAASDKVLGTCVFVLTGDACWVRSGALGLFWLYLSTWWLVFCDLSLDLSSGRGVSLDLAAGDL